MITYAQNFEDVLLERCFSSVSDGFYIDAGAWDPIVDSVTYHFYLRGWCGINIEPDPEFCEKLRSLRPLDINLQVAVSSERGEMPFYRLSEPRLSTLTNQYLNSLTGYGFAIQESSTPVLTLAEICEQYAMDKEIHFLKIDVEGMEQAVIDGADWTRFRPQVVVVEATAPFTTIPAWDAWEPRLLAAGYLFAWFDGLNRFYVRSDREELLEHFRVPPTAADMFVPYRVSALEQEVSTLNEAVQKAVAIQGDARVQSNGLEQRIEALESTHSELDSLGPRLSDMTAQLYKMMSSTHHHTEEQLAGIRARILEFISQQDRLLAKFELQDAAFSSWRARLEAQSLQTGHSLVEQHEVNHRSLSEQLSMQVAAVEQVVQKFNERDTAREHDLARQVTALVQSQAALVEASLLGKIEATTASLTAHFQSSLQAHSDQLNKVIVNQLDSSQTVLRELATQEIRAAAQASGETIDAVVKRLEATLAAKQADEVKRLKAVIEAQKQEFKTAVTQLAERTNSAVLEREGLRRSVQELSVGREELYGTIRQLSAEADAARHTSGAADQSIADLFNRVQDLEIQLQNEREINLHVSEMLKVEREARSAFERAVAELRNSVSWRLTSPLRAVYGAVNRRG